MAEDSGQEKTEQATERQIERFRQQGTVATSKELGAALSLGAGALACMAAAPMLGRGMLGLFRETMAQGATRELDPGDLVTLGAQALRAVGPATLLAIVPGVVVALAAGILMTGFNVTTEALEPKLERLDPIAAFQQRYLSSVPWVELLKGLLIVAAMSWAVWAAVKEQLPTLPIASRWSVTAQADTLLALAKGVLQRAVPVAVGIGAADFLWQKYRISQQMMMTREDVRQEMKESDGDPHLRAKRKARARQLATGRQLGDVKKADVVVANPTHFAVALRYRKEEGGAPTVVARGVDHLALQIRAEAGRHDVPVVENRPLARALYAKAKVGAPIPKEFYGPVAQVLAVVYRRRRKAPQA